MRELPGRRKFCSLVDPAHPDYDPRQACAVARLTLELAGKWVEPPNPATAARASPQAVAERRAAKPRLALGVKQKSPGKR
jgi:hypothetical protein